MIRALHRWPGLAAALLLVVMTLSGAALSVFPALEAATAPQAAAGQSAADLAARVRAALPGVEQIRVAPSGRIAAYWFDAGAPGSGVVDPATGQVVGDAEPNRVQRWLTNLHRALFLGDAGRLAVAAGAAAMLALSLTGAALVARRMGGWRRWFAPLKGPAPARLHVELARVAVAGLALSTLTGLWMAAETFELIVVEEADAGFAEAAPDAPAMPLAEMQALAAVRVAELRSLSFANPAWPGDALKIETAAGAGLIDPATGALIAWTAATPAQRASEIVAMLHTGQGAATLGLVLGLAALAAPAMAVTGALSWWAGRRGRPRLRGAAAAGAARTVILVGSEGGATWGFAATLLRALTEAGDRVHVAPMSAFAPQRYARAERILALAATYGDGAAPASAQGFLDRLAALDAPPRAPLAVLGFGDRGFPAFCAYAEAVRAAAAAKGWAELIPFDTVDRQSPQDFARWGRALGAATGIALDLVHQPVRPPSHALTLVSRRDYGAELQAPTAILRFAPPRAPLWRRLVERVSGRGFGRFAAGDLLGVQPEGSDLPRFYSLASDARDGFLEIVVRRQPGGLCSGQLMALRPGESVRAFLRRNPAFKPGRGRAPLILIGAGTGVGPLAGFIRGNARRRPIHLFFGFRRKESDFLYEPELAAWRADGRLARLSVATSRGERPRHVQDALRAEAAQVSAAIRDGARIMVCGGRDMAAGVAQALAEILAPAGLAPATLKAEGRYVEDVY